MGRIRQTMSCKECGGLHYARGLCKRHYMAMNRQKYNQNPNKKPIVQEMDMDDFWNFVKKELQIG